MDKIEQMAKMTIFVLIAGILLKAGYLSATESPYALVVGIMLSSIIFWAFIIRMDLHSKREGYDGTRTQN